MNKHMKKFNYAKNNNIFTHPFAVFLSWQKKFAKYLR